MTAWLSDARVAIHAALTAVLAWFGTVLVLPGDTFATSRAFAKMAEIGSEDHWAIAFWLAACVGIIGLRTPCPNVRLASVLAIASAHGSLAGLIVISAPYGTGSGTYAIVAALGYWTAWRQVRTRA